MIVLGANILIRAVLGRRFANSLRLMLLRDSASWLQRSPLTMRRNIFLLS